MKKLLASMMMLVLVLAGCGASNSASTDEPVTIKVAAMKDTAHMPLLYAEQTGMYKDAGLDVEITFFNSAKDRGAAWDTGDYQMETADLAEGIKLADQGEGIKITGCPAGDFKMVASPEVSKNWDGDIKSLDGMSVGLSENTVIEYYVDYVANENGISFDKKPIPAVPDRYAALQSGDIDLAILPDPFPSQAVEQGSKLVWESLQDGIPQLNTLVWNENFDNDDAISKFIEVSNEAVKEVNEKGPESFKQYAIDADVFEEEYFDDITKDMTFTELNAPTQEDWDAVSEWAKSVGMIEGNPSYDDFVFKG